MKVPEPEVEDSNLIVNFNSIEPIFSVTVKLLSLESVVEVIPQKYPILVDADQSEIDTDVPSTLKVTLADVRLASLSVISSFPCTIKIRYISNCNIL